MCRGWSRYGWASPRQRLSSPSGSLRCIQGLLASISLTLTLHPLYAQAMVAEQNQTSPTQESARRAAPVVLTLQDALKRAAAYSPQFQEAVTSAGIARQSVVQARAALLPSLDYLLQDLITQGNGVTPTGRYVTNDGIHVYRSWAVVRQTVSADTVTLAGLHHATAAEEVALAQQEIALRGLNLAVSRAYYALVVAERRYATAQESLSQAAQSLKISQELERGQQVAHIDVITFQVEYNQEQQAFQEAELTMENARLALAVMLFPDLNQDFQVIDDLDTPPPLPTLDEATKMAETNNPEIRSAMASLRETKYGVSEAKAALLPSFSLDADYGIEANDLALHSRAAAFPEAGKLPNLGFFITLSLSVPVWDWGANISKVRQAEYQKELAQTQLSSTQRQMLNNLYSDYNETRTAWSELSNLQSSASLAAEALRLNLLRYRAGDATVLDVLNAQKTLTQTRDAYATGLARYRVALSVLQTVTGSF